MVMVVDTMNEVWKKNDTQHPFRILLVEDNPGDVKLISVVISLVDVPIDLTVVNDGDSAVRYISTLANSADRFPDLVLLDINLPKKNGHEVLEIIRKDNRTRDLCVIMCSGSTSCSDLERSRRGQANGFLAKPMGAVEIDDMAINLRDILVSLDSGTGRTFWDIGRWSS
jgi:two-component system, chemotaxis family, response regulator Rcp1